MLVRACYARSRRKNKNMTQAVRQTPTWVWQIIGCLNSSLDYDTIPQAWDVITAIDHFTVNNSCDLLPTPITLHTSTWNALIWPTPGIARLTIRRMAAAAEPGYFSRTAHCLFCFFSGWSHWHCRYVARPKLQSSASKNTIKLKSIFVVLFFFSFFLFFLPAHFMQALKYKPTFILQFSYMHGWAPRALTSSIYSDITIPIIIQSPDFPRATSKGGY